MVSRPFGSVMTLGKSMVAVLGSALVLVSCASSSDTSGACEPGRPTSVTIPGPPEPGQTLRVGGNMDLANSRRGDVIRSGPCVIDTPLPAGYPDPTPPGAIDLKSYPPVRRAVIQGTGTPNRGMNRAFFPLFDHIKKHDIAMTSPVEMDYPGASKPEDVSSGAWSMAFLYRTPELNEVGTDGRVEVVDAQPVTVLAIGMKGDYGTGLVRRGAEKLEAWLGANPDWEAAGSWRSLYYNGPSLDFWNKWAEVQIPVRPRNTRTAP
jgi:SOUL heme-binding protein